MKMLAGLEDSIALDSDAVTQTEADISSRSERLHCVPMWSPWYPDRLMAIMLGLRYFQMVLVAKMLIIYVSGMKVGIACHCETCRIVHLGSTVYATLSGSSTSKGLILWPQSLLVP
jgi:hypothetical protein